MRRGWAALSVGAGLGLGACGGGAATPRLTATVTVSSTSASTAGTAPHTVMPRPRPAPSYPQLLGAVGASSTTPFVPALRWRGRTAAWIARMSSGAVLLSFDQRLVELHLHSGTLDAGTLGWRFGPSIGGGERRALAAAFNGGFRFSTGAGGFQSYGRVGAPLAPGRGSIVTYADGTSDIGSWKQEVPTPGKPVVSVRQNLDLLVDHATPATNLGCRRCWGASLGGVSDPARSALGITADGRLVWAGGEHLTVDQLAAALQAARVLRAVELDINPEWVAAYLYEHHGPRGAVVPVPALSGEHGIPGEFLIPWSRDFFSVTVR